MLKSISKSFGVYSKKPLAFVMATFNYLLLHALLLLALTGLFIIFFTAISALRYTGNLAAFAVAGAILAVLFMYFSSAFRGALIKAYAVISTGAGFGLVDMFRYSLGNGWVYFIISFLNLLLLALVNAPAAAIYFFYLQANQIPYVDVLLLLISLFFTFIVELLFYPVYIAAASYNTGIFKSFGMSLRLLTKTHLVAVALFVLYALVYLLNLVPLVQLVSIFLFYPVIYTAMIMFFQANVGRN